MKKVLLFAAGAALLAACSSDKLPIESQKQAQTDNRSIGFDVYAQKTTTRGGVAGSLTTGKLLDYAGTDPFNTAGFGVFGYYTDNNEYDQRSVPNFMYNQQVNWDGTKWDYSPVMYWPNEYGDNAKSDDSDKLTFFAYAPYIEVVPTSGKLAGATAEEVKAAEAWGITGMTRNSNQGDPILKYIASFDANKSVDLCWGVADNNDGVNWDITQTGVAQTSPSVITNGKPWIDVQRPANTDQKVKFTFKHATAQMQVKIDADVDVDGRGHTKDVADKTRVWVRSVTFKGFAMKGSLNLNNDDPNKAKWLDFNGQNELVAEDVVVYDQRKDGKEGVNGSVATNEKTIGLNPTLVQDGVYQNVNDDKTVYTDTEVKVVGVDGSSIRTGVTKTPQNLFDNGSLFHVIPVDNEAFEVEIVYDIETVDANLAQNLSDGQTKGSSIENHITKKVTFGSDEYLHTGHSYILNLHLGMNSVKFDAAVVEWIAEPTQDVDLPLNIPAFAAANPATSKTVPLPFKGDYSFAITGLDGGESVGISPTSPITVTTGYATWAATKDNANTTGIAIQKLTTAVNPTTTDRTQTITWTGSQSGKGVKVTFTQKAHPLFMTISGFANNGSKKGEITLTRWNDETHISSSDWKKTDDSYNNAGWLADKTDGGSAVIRVWRNGIELDNSALGSDPTGNKFKFADAGTDATNTITIGDKLQPGDVIKVELTTGDAPTETVTARYDGFYFVESTKSETYRAGATNIALPELKNAYGSVSYTIAPSGFVTITGDEITGMTTSGTATITATDGGGNTTTLKLTVTKQTVEIVNISDETLPNKTLTEVTSGKTIKNFSANGKGEYDDPVGNVTYNLYTAKKGDVNVKNKFTFDAGTKELKTADNLESGTYVIRFLVNLSLDEDKYVKPAQKSIYITFTVD